MIYVMFFWKKKIKSNIERDVRDVKALKKLGYKVVRFWGSDLKKAKNRIRIKLENFLDVKRT